MVSNSAMLNKFEQDDNTEEAAKKISCVKRAGPVDYSTVTRKFKKFDSILQELWRSGKGR